jgi:hypothetical protein
MRELTTTLSLLNRTLRYLTGAVLVMLPLLDSNAPPWLAIIGLYPVFTAMIGGDLLTQSITRLGRPSGRRPMPIGKRVTA